MSIVSKQSKKDTEIYYLKRFLRDTINGTLDFTDELSMIIREAHCLVHKTKDVYSIDRTAFNGIVYLSNVCYSYLLDMDHTNDITKDTFKQILSIIDGSDI